tara:strand:- start:141 stop:758 length:618 start_codon:yes stop_codon:yes gene_type:complete
MIAIIDHNYINLKSISNSLNFLNFNYRIIKAENLTDEYSHAIIPGVGNFSNAMQGLRGNNGDKKIIEFAKNKKPIMGICLGMQLLATLGDEDGPTEGLNLIPGNVKKININDKQFLPHIGWNSVKFTKDHPVLDGIKNEMDFYFVHSYSFYLNDEENSLGKTIYNESLNSIVAKENIIGFQFHPEKSQKYGLKLLNNFCEWNTKC